MIIRFWGIGDARVTCPNCGEEHEVEAGEMENLTTDEKSEIALLVVVERVEDGKRSGLFEQKN